jgi:hypothetical protein
MKWWMVLYLRSLMLLDAIGIRLRDLLTGVLIGVLIGIFIVWM